MSMRLKKFAIVGLRSSDTILSVKKGLEDLEGIDPFQQNLYFNMPVAFGGGMRRVRLTDESTLADYGIEKNATLTFELALRASNSVYVKSGFTGDIIAVIDLDSSDTVETFQEEGS
jgi:hypothetical protein